MIKKMNPEIKKEWVERLEADLPQTTGTLTRLDYDGNIAGQCCLGVLCEIAVEHGVARSEDVGSVRVYGDGTNVSSATYLPYAVAKWAGVDGSGVYPSFNLARMNDTGSSFREIALTIRENL